MIIKQNHWDIFCVVVDNYGDIGVTWRLAQQLSKEYNIPVNLWVDDLLSFSHILPSLDPSIDQQSFFGVNIIHWNKPNLSKYQVGECIIEAFACELPSQIINKLLQAKQEAIQPVWLNLEYLSAEDWVDGCHALPSLQQNGLSKYFYFPGFTTKTGGLICEKSLLSERIAFEQDPANKLALFDSLGLTGIEKQDTVISVFSYESDALPALIEALSEYTTPVHVLIPKGRSLNSLTGLINKSVCEINPKDRFTIKNLTLHILPMTNQSGFDKLLWSCDFNIVRGEDSFLRAQWAAKPFIWHIYPQEDDYHLIKLHAFMTIYCDNLAPEISQAWQKLNLAFNQGDAELTVNAWQQLEFCNEPLKQHAKKWPITALNDADLATRLVEFVKSR